MPRHTTDSSRTPPFWAVLVVLCLVPLAALGFGAVHLWPRAILTAAMAISGAVLALRSRYVDRPALLWCVASALLLAVIPLIPMTEALRSGLQGELAVPVSQTMTLTGAELRPLALDPHGALSGWAEAIALCLLGWGVAGWTTRAGRVQTLLWSLLASGVVIVLLMVGHTQLGAESIYGSGLGAGTRDGFFAPFINPNHGGIFCAALMPIAFSRVAGGRPLARLMGIVCLSIFAFGVWASGSRGAVVTMGLALSATVAAVGGPLVRKGVVGLLGLGFVGVLVVGPRRALKALGSLVAPSVNQMADAGYVDLTTGRLRLFSDALEVIVQSFPLGVGGGGFDIAHRIVKSDPAFNATTHVHNEYLQLIAEQGIFVGALIAFAMALIVRQGIAALSFWHDRPDRRWQLAGLLGCLTGLAVASTVDFPLRLFSHSILAVLCFGGLVGLSRPQRGGRSLGPKGRKLIGLGLGLGMLALAAGVHGNAGMWGRADRARADGQAWMKVARKGGDQDAFSAAHAHFERAVVRGLQRQDYQWLAAAAMGDRQPQKAVAALTAGTSMYPTMPWLWRDRARLAQRMNDSIAAREAWLRMLTLDLPSRVDPVDVLHEALFGGDFDTPIAQARAILPERADRYRQAARVMDQLGLVEESETLFRHALSLDPQGVQYFSEALIRWGRPADAVMLLEVNRTGCKGEQRYAESLLKIDRVQDAAKAFAKALGMCGARAWSLRVGLAKARLLSGDSRGEDVVEQLLEERPDSHGLRRVWLWVLSRRGRPVDGVRHLEHLKYAGVMRPVEEAALERARQGLPFSLPRPR